MHYKLFYVTIFCGGGDGRGLMFFNLGFPGDLARLLQSIHYAHTLGFSESKKEFVSRSTLHALKPTVSELILVRQQFSRGF